MNFLNTIRTRKVLSSSLILFTLSIGILIGTLINTGVRAAKDTVAAPGATPLVIPNPVQLSNAFSQLAKQLEPSVVNISTSYEPKEAAATPAPQGKKNRRQAPSDDEDSNDAMNDFFNRFFGNGSPFGGETPRGAPQNRRGGQALGSGVIVDPNGYILTNNHVVEKADRIQVTLSGTSSKLDAKLIGADPDTDLAVIKIDAHRPLPAAKIGNSDAVQVGDWAVAIGSPFGLEATVTAGIISAKERDLKDGGEHQFQKFLQTDAAINPGNSGGPLLAINGDVIGINTAIVSGSGGYQGVGFALPINTAAKVYNQIIKNGKVTRGAIGVRFEDGVKPELLSIYGGVKEGVFVLDVTPDMPAAKAGIKEQDIITAIDDKPVKNGQELVNRISEAPVGSEVKIAVLRNKNRQTFMVKIGDRKDLDTTGLKAPGGEPNKAEKSEAVPAKFGISIQELPQARKDSIGLKEKGGVEVQDVMHPSFAEDIGLTEKDVIVAINTHPVATVADVQRIQATLKPGDPVAFHVMRGLGGARQGRSQSGGSLEWRSIFLAGTMP